MTYENDVKTKRVYKEALTEYMSRSLWFAVCGAVIVTIVSFIILGLNTVSPSTPPIVYPKDPKDIKDMVIAMAAVGAIFGCLLASITTE